MSVRRLAVTTNVAPNKSSSGDVGCMVWLAPGQAGAFREFSLTMLDFWQLGNVVYDSEHADFAYSGAYGSDMAELTDAIDDILGKYVKQFTYDFSSNPSGYAGMYYGPAPDTSSGTTGLNFDFYSSVAGNVEFTAKDAGNISRTYQQQVNTGWQPINIPWVGGFITYSLQDIGTLGGDSAIAYGISDDGAIIVGYSQQADGNPRAFRWTQASGLVNLGVLTGGTGSRAFATSSDGSAVVGECQISPSEYRAFRWTQSGGMVDLGVLPGGTASHAYAVSADGSVVVGECVLSSGNPHAFRWTQAGGLVDLGVVGTYSRATGISDDGNIIVGYGDVGGGNIRALRWVSGAVEILGLFYGSPPSWSSYAFGISGDGSTIIGAAATVEGLGAFRWTQTEGMVNLGELPGDGFGSGYSARALSNDGTIIVGYGNVVAGSQPHAFRWTQASGMVDLGVLAGDLSSYAYAISGNGNIIAGYGQNAAYIFSAFRCDTPVFAHPVSSFNVDAVSAMNAATFKLNNMRYDDIVTMYDLAPAIVNGIQFAIVPVDAGTEDYLFHMNHVKINAVMIDGTVAEPDKYKGIPRWTYKWTLENNVVGYGAWRGPSAVGYMWLTGWTESGIVNPDNGRVMSDAMLQFLYDSQQAYITQFPGKQIGPFVPRYGRQSWEALMTGGYVAGVWTDNTNGKWYWPGTDDWYGYMMRPLAATAQHYYLTESAQAKTILDNWMAWLDVYIIVDGAYWQPPSGYGNDGNPTYTYKPVYAYVMIAQACIYKYWIDGDALALKWYRRMLDTIYATKRMTSTGNCIGISRTTEGEGYTTATVSFTVNSGATAPNATPVIAGGKIPRYVVNSQGSGITSITAVVSGDGFGATCNPYLNDLLVGAFDVNHTGWELPEIFNAYAMLVNGSKPGGTVHFPTSYTATDSVAFVGLIALYQRNTVATRPSMLNSYGIPLHEWDIDPYHNNTGIENPMYKDTHARGALWTETLAPTMYAAVEYGRYSGDWTWLESLYELAREYTGLSGGSTRLYPTPRASNGLMDAYTDIIGGEPLQANKSGNIDSAAYAVTSSKQIIIPLNAGGGGVTWVRGAWKTAIPFRWDGFMADIDPDYVGDTTNFANVDSGSTAINVNSRF